MQNATHTGDGLYTACRSKKACSEARSTVQYCHYTQRHKTASYLSCKHQPDISGTAWAYTAPAYTTQHQHVSWNEVTKAYVDNTTPAAQATRMHCQDTKLAPDKEA